jgi:hypothetical protein
MSFAQFCERIKGWEGDTAFNSLTVLLLSWQLRRQIASFPLFANLASYAPGSALRWTISQLRPPREAERERRLCQRTDTSMQICFWTSDRPLRRMIRWWSFGTGHDWLFSRPLTGFPSLRGFVPSLPCCRGCE